MKKLLCMITICLLLSMNLFSMGEGELTYPNPEKPITVVIPFGAGGSTDIIFRALADEMSKISGHNFIISNVGGAGSATGTNEVLNSEADGYTLLGGGTHTIAATMQGLTQGYKQLECVAALNWDPFVIAVTKDKTWNTFSDLVNDAKANPGKITLGNAGMGGATGVASVGINLAFDKNFNVTPFNGGSDLIASVLGKHCDVGIFSQSEVVANLDAFKPLAILGNERSIIKELSYIPTLEESGFSGLSIPNGSFRSVLVKEGTPQEAIDWLVKVIEEAFHSEEFQNFMNSNGLIESFYVTEEFEAYNQTIINEYEPILKEAGLYKM